MLTYAKLAKTPAKFQRFTGLTVEEFDQLAEEVEEKWKAAERQRLVSRPRQRAVGGGGQYKLESILWQVAGAVDVLSTVRDI